MLLTKIAAILGAAIAMAIVAGLTMWWDAGVADGQQRLAAYQGEVRGGRVNGTTMRLPW